MAKYKEIVSMVLDKLKLFSDDSVYTEDHIIFQAGIYRTFLLKQRYYNDIKKQIPESNYQTICLNLEVENSDPCTDGCYLKSKEEVPSLLPVGTTKVFPAGVAFENNVVMVSPTRIKYVGGNKWLKNIIYAAIGPDNKVILKSDNPQFKYLEQVSVTGIFEDAEAASELECANKDADGNIIECDILDRDFPLEEALIAPLIELIHNQLAPSIAAPEDKENNANDNLSPEAKG